MNEGIVLAGGRSKRMGKPKAFLDFDGTPLLRRIVDRIKCSVSKTYVVISSDESEKDYQEILPDDVLIIHDLFKGQAPLIGIYSGLKAVTSKNAFITSCDTPFVNSKVVDLLFDEIRGFDIAIPKWPNGLLEPLHAVYSVRKTVNATIQALENKRLKNLSILDGLDKINYVPVNRLKKFDEELHTFFNINTNLDYSLAKEISLKKYKDL